MRPADAALMLVADSLARDLPANAQLTELSLPRPMLTAASSGTLPPLLHELRVEPDVAALAKVWPRALAPALRRVERLPNTFVFQLHLAQTAAYLFFVGVLQLAVTAVLSLKVFPVFEAMGDTMGSTDLFDLMGTTSFFFALGALPVIAWVALGLPGWRRMPGWGRDYARAREATLAAALLEAGAPDDVRSAWLKQGRLVRESTQAEGDLDAVARDAAVSVEQRMARFVATVRVLGLSLLTLNAAGVLVTVYSTLTRLSAVAP